MLRGNVSEAVRYFVYFVFLTSTFSYWNNSNSLKSELRRNASVSTSSSPPTIHNNDTQWRLQLEAVQKELAEEKSKSAQELQAKDHEIAKLQQQVHELEQDKEQQSQATLSKLNEMEQKLQKIAMARKKTAADNSPPTTKTNNHHDGDLPTSSTTRSAATATTNSDQKQSTTNVKLSDEVGNLKGDQQPVKIALNANSTIASDIVAIYHVPQRSRVMVQLQASARCPRPYLVGRLSGPALVMLDWTWSVLRGDQGGGTILTGSYTVPVAGEYFLDIMIVHCHDFTLGTEAAFQNQDFSSETLEGGGPNPLTYNFQKTCTEDPARGRLVSDTASIVVQNVGGSSQVEGFWNQAITVSTPVAAHTRYQPAICWDQKRKKRDQSPICYEQPDPEQLINSYDFSWSSSLQKQINLPSLRQPSLTTVCLAGWSHSRKLMEAAARMGFRNKQNIERYNVTTGWVKAKYPGDLPSQLKSIQKQQCKSLIIGVAQWPASFDGPQPTLFLPYYRQMKWAVQQLQSEMPDLRIMFRSVHKDTLMGSTVRCPPGDWRTPTVFDGYRKVLQQLSHELHVPYVDTSFLTDPLWDASKDYSHHDDKISNKEILYLVAAAVGKLNNDIVSSGESKQSNVDSLSTAY